ncbi:MAG: hypothetical protein ABH983_04110 [Candidatus Micrarchaeota archaeon]
MSIETILNEMKEKGIGGAVVQADGVPMASTIALKEVDASLFASIANVAEAIMQREDDSPQEMELSFGGLLLIMVPINHHIFCGLIKDREEKKIVLEYAQRARTEL